MPGSTPDEREVTVTFSLPQAQVVARLLRQRLAVVEGERILARRRLDGGINSGNQRRKAVERIETAEERIAIAEGAYDAVRKPLRAENIQFEDAMGGEF